jgi:hypothetical protein
MKKLILVIALIFIADGIYSSAKAQSGNLKIVLVRHGEKETNGDNLNCQGLNRALQIPKVLVGKFGVPKNIYVPTLNAKKSTSHSRMFQTASPLAIKYTVAINSKYDVEDYAPLAKAIEAQTGTILIVWEHNAMHDIIKALGVNAKGIQWPDEDFDSIWIVTYKKGQAVLTMDKEGLSPAANCQF